MCSRYQFVFENLEKWNTLIFKASQQQNLGKWTGGEIAPGMEAPVFVAKDGQVKICFQRWGIPVSSGRIVINARAETVCERPLFKDAVLYRRCVVPTTGFYGGGEPTSLSF